VSQRPRRALLGLVAAVAALAAAPSVALAAGETITVTPSNLQAGGSTTVTSAAHFAPGAGDTPKAVVISDPPGLLASLNANPSCITGTPQLTASCQVGTASVTANSTTSSGNAVYLVPPQSSTDFAGIDTVVGSAPPQYTGVSLRMSPTVGVNLTTNFTQVSGVQVTDVSTTLNPTLNGQPFTRMPTSCAAATTTMTVTYFNGTPTNTVSSAPFMPSGCQNLPYSPNLSASIAADSHGGASLVLGVTQAANESASKSFSVTFPKGLTPNVTADAPCLNATGCQIGTATATSPLVPNSALASGKLSLGGSVSSPAITIAFPGSFGLTITGAVSLTSNSVTFSNLPDIPISALTLNITGPNGQKAFLTDCAPASVTGTFNPQSGTPAHNSTAPIKFTGCATATATGSTSGLASGHPKLKFKITRSSGSPNISSVAVGLPGGLSFSRSAFASHKTCTTAKGKKKCTTTTLIRGLGISGATAKSVALRGGKLVVNLKKAASSVTITASGPLASETKALQTKVKKHKAGKLTFSLKVTNAKGTSSTLPLKLAAH
jgi:hypothetical protein